MSEEIKNFIDKLGDGNNIEAGDAFKDALRTKVGDTLDAKRKELASQLFSTAQSIPNEATSFSDPKPEIAEPGTFNQDGSVTNQNDGSVDIDLTSDEAK
tara:strand:+ start:2018 stop:2314 length:297 start_codon:yes stop_codon:yes gene_type:complete